MEILHAGLPPTLLQQIQENLELPNAVFVSAPPEKPSVITQQASDPIVFLIGEEVNNQIREAQEIYRLDRYLSVLIISNRADFQKLKQALQFSPFIGPTVQLINAEAGPALAAIIADHAQRTSQRRNYARITASSSVPSSATSQLFEQIRADYLGKMMEEAPIGAILLNHEGAVLNMNNYGLRLLDKTEQEVLNCPFHRLFPEYLQAKIQEFIINGFRHESKRMAAIPVTGGSRYLEISVAEITGGSNASYRICILNDITDNVLAKQRIESQLEEIESMNENLLRVNNDLDTFVYTASHDLKSPILNIEGLVTILKDDLKQTSPQVQNALTMIERSVYRFKATLNDLTEVAKIQKAQHDLSMEINLREAISEVTERIEHEIIRSGATIQVNTENAPQLYFSGKNIKSILYNLISNGIKYCPPTRKPRITISSAITDGNFVLSVTDNGLGIPEEKLGQIFTLFHRLNPEIEGTGIGLYIVKRIVENAQGHIEVDSRVNHGSTFNIFLPQQSKE